jgi:hypothetical protein
MMRRIESKSKYDSLLGVLATTDLTSQNSVVKTVIINKMINFLYMKLSAEDRQTMVEMLKHGINYEFVAFMENNLTEDDQKEIAEIVSAELREIYNSALIANTNAATRRIKNSTTR